jgi:uncharacterized damage-inducible protein DinB
MQVIDLIRYNHVVRETYLEAFSRLPWAQVVEFRGLSWDSMRDVFVHLTLVEDRWVNFVIPERFKDWVDPDFDAFTNMDSLRDYMQGVHANTEKFLTNLKPEELDREIVVPWGEKPYVKLSVEAVLTHMVMEDMVHYGELSAAFWQMGLEPPYKAYWRFKHQNP